jgi:hypothetical protein
VSWSNESTVTPPASRKCDIFSPPIPQNYSQVYKLLEEMNYDPPPVQSPPDASKYGSLPSSHACQLVVLMEISTNAPLNGKLYDHLTL